jgi:hypothetical protein
VLIEFKKKICTKCGERVFALMCENCFKEHLKREHEDWREKKLYRDFILESG